MTDAPTVALPTPDSRSAAPPSNDQGAASADPLPAHLLRTRVQPVTGWQAVDLRELWRYRELTWFLALRDLKVRYKQTVLGAAWAIIQPVMNTVIFTLIFNKLAGVKSEPGIPYTVMTFCAQVPWQLFETSVTQAGNSLIGSQNLITKVYFPRLSIPLSSVLAAVVDFLIAFVVLIGLMAFYRLFVPGYHFGPGWAVLTLPLFVLMALALALGIGLWLSALNVQYRDIRYAIPFMTRLWFFATPIIYPSDIVAKKLGPTLFAIYGLNPMAGVVEGFEWCLLGKQHPSFPLLAVSAAMTVLLLVGGMFYFRRMEQTFADIV